VLDLKYLGLVMAFGMPALLFLGVHLRGHAIVFRARQPLTYLLPIVGSLLMIFGRPLGDYLVEQGFAHPLYQVLAACLLLFLVWGATTLVSTRADILLYGARQGDLQDFLRATAKFLDERPKLVQGAWGLPSWPAMVKVEEKGRRLRIWGKGAMELRAVLLPILLDAQASFAVVPFLERWAPLRKRIALWVFVVIAISCFVIRD